MPNAIEAIDAHANIAKFSKSAIVSVPDQRRIARQTTACAVIQCNMTSAPVSMPERPPR
jgi:hypothetical protein